MARFELLNIITRIRIKVCTDSARAAQHVQLQQTSEKYVKWHNFLSIVGASFEKISSIGYRDRFI